MSASPPLAPAGTLLRDLDSPSGAARLADVYGSNPARLANRRAALARLLEHFRERYGDLPVAVYRCPARISLNPHSDHQGAWVPYGCHTRELLTVIAPAEDDRVELANLDPAFARDLGFSVAEEIARAPEAWQRDWFEYVEAPGVVDSVKSCLDAKGAETGRRATLNYVRAGVLRMRRLAEGTPLPGLRMAFHGDIPQGGGLSSSSALVVTAALATAELGGLSVERRRLAELCGEAEWYVGTRGGSGDHSAMLLGSAAGLVHLRFRAPFGVRDLRLSRFPAGYELLLANSKRRSEKSAEERLMFNRGIFAYRFAFLALRDALREGGAAPEVVDATESLGDLNVDRLPAAELYRLLLRLPEHVSPRELAASYPAVYPGAARGCFGTADPDRLPSDIPLRGAAAYGLGRVDRGRVMPGLLDAATPEAIAEFGRLMSITHDGDRLFRHGQAYTENQEGLSNAALSRRAAEVAAGDERPLRDLPGFYGAGIAELDRMVDVAEGVDGVLGAGLMGAGGGGYVLILLRQGARAAVAAALEREYYRPLGLEPDVEPWIPSPPAGRLL